jgi:hypothetical protein
MTPEPLATEENQEEILEAIDANADEADELLDSITELSKKLDIGQVSLAEKIESCRNRLEVLLTTQTAENPLLTQLLTQVVEIRTELTALKQSMDSRVNPPILKESVEVLPVENPAEPSLEKSTDEPNATSVEPEKKKRATFI